MKKSSLLLIAIISMHMSHVHAATLQENIERRMTSYHNAAFGENVIKKAIPKTDLDNWNNVVGEVKSFANKNIVLDQELSQASRSLNKINEELMVIIPEAHNALYRNHNLQRLPEFQDALETLIDKTDALKIKLKKDKDKGYKITGNQNTVAILYRLAVTLSTTAKKVKNELPKS